MGADSGIEWTDHTFNPWWGCEKVSAGCTHCYADTFANRLGHGTTRPKLWGPSSERKVASESMWREPLKWNRAAEKAGKRARVFCASMADVFEDREELRAPRRRLFGLIAATAHLDWLLLTKRPEFMREWINGCGQEEASIGYYDGLQAYPNFPNPHNARPWSQEEYHSSTGVYLGTTHGCDDDMPWPLPNVWLGTTCEDQAAADKRIPLLLAAQASVRFLSVEPMIGPVDLTRIAITTGCHDDVLGDGEWRGVPDAPPGIDWVIVGGESGHGARPMREEWVRSLRDQCAAARVPFFYKQRIDGGLKVSLPMLDGVRHTDLPEVPRG